MALYRCQLPITTANSDFLYFVGGYTFDQHTLNIKIRNHMMGLPYSVMRLRDKLIARIGVLPISLKKTNTRADNKGSPVIRALSMHHKALFGITHIDGRICP